MPRRRAATRNKRLTRGPRKGKVITVYVRSGTEVKTAKRRKALGQRYAKTRTAKPGKTTSHAAAGLHRLGRTGNRYVDRGGRVFMRGKGGTFKLGDVNRRKKNGETH